jgi:hypothetical protein
MCGRRAMWKRGPGSIASNMEPKLTFFASSFWGSTIESYDGLVESHKHWPLEVLVAASPKNKLRCTVGRGDK